MSFKKARVVHSKSGMCAQEIKDFLSAVERHVSKGNTRIDWENLVLTEKNIDRDAAQCRALWRELAYGDKPPADNEESDIEASIAQLRKTTAGKKNTQKDI